MFWDLCAFRVVYAFFSVAFELSKMLHWWEGMGAWGVCCALYNAWLGQVEDLGFQPCSLGGGGLDNKMCKASSSESQTHPSMAVCDTKHNAFFSWAKYFTTFTQSSPQKKKKYSSWRKNVKLYVCQQGIPFFFFLWLFYFHIHALLWDNSMSLKQEIGAI